MSTTKLHPKGNRILVKRAAEQDKTKGGIIIPDMAKERPIEGEVMAVGPGRVLDNGTLHKPDVKAGDHILFGKYCGTEAKVDGIDHLVITEDDILATIERAPAAAAG